MFEIKIAVLGYVSAGKTTVLNALLRHAYGQVSMRRTTAGVNYFRLLSHHQHNNSSNKAADCSEESDFEETATSSDLSCTSHPPPPSPAGENESESSIVSSGESWTVEAEEESSLCYRTAESTHQEISVDNEAFRESSEVHVKSFDIAIEEPLGRDMRDDVKLVLVDIPGINEAGAGGKYRTFVTDKWDTLDCVIVVMDGRQGANTEEQVNLLKFVRKNNAEKKDVPVIILCNKVDDPEDEEQAELVKEARQEVERIFNAPDRESALRLILENTTMVDNDVPAFPAFIPTSAVLAYIYRTASLMTMDQFKKFEKNLVEKLGRKELGWKWRNLSQDEKVQLAYEIVSDQSLYQDRIEATNFDKLLKVLAYAVGGSDVQVQLIQKQIDVTLRNLSPGKDVVGRIRAVCEKRQVLGQDYGGSESCFLGHARSIRGRGFQFACRESCSSRFTRLADQGTL